MQKHAGVDGLSKSVGQMPVPDLVGLTEAQAEAALAAVNMVGSTVLTTGPVVSQDPIAGTNAARGSTVTYTLTS